MPQRGRLWTHSNLIHFLPGYMVHRETMIIIFTAMGYVQKTNIWVIEIECKPYDLDTVNQGCKNFYLQLKMAVVGSANLDFLKIIAIYKKCKAKVCEKSINTQ